jgi:hypothetical protein
MYGLHDPCILKSNKYDPTKCVILYITYNITIHILIVEKILRNSPMAVIVIKTRISDGNW